MEERDDSEQQTSFGVQKIVDCKIVEGGQQMYKVEWEATWEPAESLVSCQHLVDEFWSFVNIAKENEEVAQEHRKRMKLQQSTNNLGKIDQTFDRMSDENKADVQRLIARTHATSIGNSMLRSPSNMLMAQHGQQSNLLNTTCTPTHSNNPDILNSLPQSRDMQMASPAQKSLDFISSAQQHQNVNSLSQKGKFKAPAPPVKADSSDSLEQTDAKLNLHDSKSSGTASLKYLENFSNPYVKIIVVCKICNKEQSLKFASYWRQHFLTHSDTKPHKCPHCPKTFTRPVLMRKHVQSKHGNLMSGVDSQNFAMVAPKQEYKMAQGNVKDEDYLY